MANLKISPGRKGQGRRRKWLNNIIVYVENQSILLNRSYYPPNHSQTKGNNGCEFLLQQHLQEKVENERFVLSLLLFLVGGGGRGVGCPDSRRLKEEEEAAKSVLIIIILRQLLLLLFFFLISSSFDAPTDSVELLLLLLPVLFLSSCR